MSIPGAKIMIVGPGGTGKTHCQRTIPDTGLKPFAIYTDPGMSVASPKELGIHYRYLKSANVSWDVLKDVAKKTATLGPDGVLKYKGNNTSHTEYVEFLSACNEFVCDCCGENWGDIAEWGTDRILIIDNLSALCKMSRYLLVGGRTAMSQPELYLAQGNLQRVLDKIALELQCWVLAVFHTDQDRDEFTGRVTTYPSTPTIGKALRTQFSPNFSDVILAKRVGTEFTWSTTQEGVDGLKANNVPWADNIKPDFAPVVARWKERGGEL